ncbi:hypothetical protein BDV97DRAFT_230635 [Delphinella strobiligena]|nr:hypothetical protein BDV97DRAFT_230635 [Delphinella strobiligena]
MFPMKEYERSEVSWLAVFPGSSSASKWIGWPRQAGSSPASSLFVCCSLFHHYPLSVTHYFVSCRFFSPFGSTLFSDSALNTRILPTAGWASQTNAFPVSYLFMWHVGSSATSGCAPTRSAFYAMMTSSLPLSPNSPQVPNRSNSWRPRAVLCCAFRCHAVLGIYTRLDTSPYSTLPYPTLSSLPRLWPRLDLSRSPLGPARFQPKIIRSSLAGRQAGFGALSSLGSLGALGSRSLPLQLTGR